MEDINYLKKLQEAMMGNSPTREEYVTDPNAQVDQINEQASSPYMQEAPKAMPEPARQPASQPEVPSPAPEISPQEKLINELRKVREEKNQEIADATKSDASKAMWANVAKALGNIGAAQIQRDAGVKAGLQNFAPVKGPDTASALIKQRDSMLKNLMDEYALMNKGAMTPYQQAMIDLKKSSQGPSFEEKERTKADIKEMIQTNKENRKSVQDAKKSLSSIDEQINRVKKARDLIQKSSNESGLADTGPLDQYLNKFSDKGQKIEQALNSVSLDTMTKMFSGMSKAIDSDAERAFFQASQPSVGKYPSANIDILNGMISNLESLKNKNQDLINQYKPSGEIREEPLSKKATDTISSDTVLMQAPNGQVAKVKKDQVQKYLDKGAKIIEE